jgi:hypothetical protein
MARRPQAWLADLLIAHRALAPDREALDELARMLGLRLAVAHRPRSGLDARPPAAPTTAPSSGPDEFGRPLAQKRPPPPPPPAASEPLPKIISTFTRDSSAAPTLARPAWLDSVAPLAAGLTPRRRDVRPLFSRVHRRSILSYALATEVAEGALDVTRIVDLLSRRQPIRTLPRQRSRTLRFGAEVLIDRSPWMAPWFEEQDALADYLETLLPDGRLSITEFSGTPRSSSAARARAERAPVVELRRPIVVLGDVGIGYRFSAHPVPSRAGWIALARAASRAGRRLVVLAPYHRSRWPAAIARHVPLLHWSERTTVADAARLGGGHRPQRRATDPGAETAATDPVRTLARLVSLAVRVDRWLLRECRLTLAPQLDVGVEADLWFSASVGSRGAAGFVFKPAFAHCLREELRQQGELVVQGAAALVERAHAAFPEAVRLEERLTRLSVLGQVDEAAVEQALRPALKSIAAHDRAALDVARWASHAWERLSPDVQTTPSARRLAFAAAMRLHSDRWLRTSDDEAPEMPGDMAWLLPPDADDMVVGLEVRRWSDEQVGLHIVEPSTVTNAHHHLRVPRTKPAWIEVGARTTDADVKGERAVMAAEVGASLQLPMLAAAGGRWALHTIAGDGYELALPEETVGIGASLVWITPSRERPDAAALTGIVAAPGLVITASGGPAEGRTAVVWSQSLDHSYDAIVRARPDAGWAAHWIPDGRRAIEPPDALIPLDLDVAPLVRRLRDADGDNARLFWLQPPPVGLTSRDVSRLGEQYAFSATRLGSVSEPSRTGLLVRGEVRGRFALASPSRRGRGLHDATRLKLIVGEARQQRRAGWRCYVAYQRSGAEAAHLAHETLRSRLGRERVLFDRGSQFPDEPHPSTLPIGVTALDAYLWVGPPPRTANSRRELEHIRALHIPLLWIPLEEKPDDALKKVPPGLEDLFNDRCWLAPPGLKLPLDAAVADRLAEAIARWDPWEQEAPTMAEAPLQPERPPTLVKRVGTSIREQLIGRLDNREHATELYHTPLLQPFARRVFVVPRGPEPILLLVHGGMQDAEEAFGSLWDASNMEPRQRLASVYGERVLVFDYHSVSRSSIENTLALAEPLPANATLHLLTLSAGGLIGELLSRGERTDGRPPFDDQDFAIADSGRESDRTALRALGGLLERKRFRLERFVRVACPARGSTFYQDAPEKAVALVSSLSSIFSAPIGLLARQFAKPLRALFADDRLSPGIGDLAPTSALIRLLNRPDVDSRSDLAIVTGIQEAGGVWSTLRMLPVRAVHGEDNDLLVLASSTTGGVRRASGARVLVDRGPQVTHFNYFRNASTLGPIVGALLDGSDAVPAFRPLPAEKGEPQ